MDNNFLRNMSRYLLSMNFCYCTSIYYIVLKMINKSYFYITYIYQYSKYFILVSITNIILPGFRRLRRYTWIICINRNSYTNIRCRKTICFIILLMMNWYLVNLYNSILTIILIMKKEALESPIYKLIKYLIVLYI